MKSRQTSLLAIAVFFAATAEAQTPLAKFIDEITARPPYDHAIWGIAVEEEDGLPLYSRNAHALLTPASNRKLFAASAAVSCLGASHQFETQVWLDSGDLVLQGGGDPSFGGRYFDPPEQAFAPIIEALHRSGIHSIRDIVADVSLFDRVTIPHSWKVGNLPAGYSAPVDALTYAENMTPQLDSVPEPGLFAAAALRETLQGAGIPVRGSIRLRSEPRAWDRQLTTIPSPFVEQLIGRILQNSQNLYTEVLFKDLSAGVSGAASYDASLEVERRFLIDEVGVDASEVHFVDGCGLSPDDLVSPFAIIRMLRWMNAPSRRGIFVPNMASPNELGTLHHRLGELGPRMHGKTGTINGVDALSGFVAGANGHDRYFSIIINHHLGGSRETENIIDAIVSEIAKF